MDFIEFTGDAKHLLRIWACVSLHVAAVYAPFLRATERWCPLFRDGDLAHRFQARSHQLEAFAC
jgi:hypothetical protein